MRARPLVVVLALGWIVFAVPAHLHAEVTSAPRTELLTLHSRIFGNTRTIRVWLPPGYDDPAQANSRYPVFYFTDGIASFHGRHLDTIAEELIRSGKIPATIFVGIDNGGSTVESKNPGSDRANEYLPYPDSFLDPPLPNPRGNLFPDFLEQEVRHLVESKFRTQDGYRARGRLLWRSHRVVHHHGTSKEVPLAVARKPFFVHR